MNEINNTDAYLRNLKIKELNDMQVATIAAAETHNNIILLSNTGSGKTLAFLLPMLATLKDNISQVQALLLVPSRELALQIEGVLKLMQTGFKVLACYGGHKREIEENSLIEPPAVIIATAGRMADHIRRRNIDLSQIQYLIVDEFDKSLELGFLEEMQFIIDALPAVKKRMLTSATFSETIPDFLKMQQAKTLNFLSGEAPTTDGLVINTVLSPDKDKLETLLQLICYVRNTSTIIFCNHRDSVERTSQFLTDKGLINVFYHGGMEQQDREVALTKFRNTSSDILVTTDLASRGLDVANIRNIIHYHLPADEAAFIHRNGRTARNGATGNVYVIYAQGEKIPEYFAPSEQPIQLTEALSFPDKPKWSTLYIGAGKKDKINKIDIVGFLSQKAQLKKDEIGLIEVKDFMAFAAVRKSKIGTALELIRNEKIKGKRVKITIAK
jgi:superfamily II DNA/RNA helicase